MSNWLQSLSDDIKAIHTEAVFNSRMDLIDGYHEIGMTIATNPDYQRHAKGNKSFVRDLARISGIGPRSIYYAIKFYDKYPEWPDCDFEEGKNISWNKIITKYLPDDQAPSIQWFERWYRMRGMLETFAIKYQDVLPKRFIDLLNELVGLEIE